MKTKLYVGNLSSRVTEEGLHFLFSQKGKIAEIKLTTERTTGRSRAFALVTMATSEGATAALEGLHQHIWNGRHITVNEARVEEVAAQQTISNFFPIKTRPLT